MIGHSGCRGWLHCRLGQFDLRLDWEVDAGETLVLFGPSGSGKTTALRALAGLVRPVSGHIDIAGQPVYDSADQIWVPAHRRRVGYLTQQYHLFPHLNLAQNISYGLGSGWRNPQSGNSALEIEEILDAFQLRGLEERFPWELSGGQQQRVALARAMATQPQLLLLDEPFSALDAGLRRSLRHELRLALERRPIPVILVTHDREEALSMGDSVQVIDEGRTIARGLPIDVLGQPGQTAVARLVGVENLFRMKVESRHPRDGTMRLSGEGNDIPVVLEAPLDDGPLDERGGDWVTVGIRASDIIISSDEPVGSSARNQLPGTVSRIEARPPGYLIELDCGVPLHCQVTGASIEEMGSDRDSSFGRFSKRRHASSCGTPTHKARRTLSHPKSSMALALTAASLWACSTQQGPMSLFPGNRRSLHDSEQPLNKWPFFHYASANAGLVTNTGKNY